jgi:serine/threonine protein kinase
MFNLSKTIFSYLHINGFIHRDIKAANLLIDDDGTVLLGDLGVAADLTEDTSHTSTSHSHSQFISARITQVNSAAASSSAGKRAVLFDDDSVPLRPRMGKRKSFVGTVDSLSFRPALRLMIIFFSLVGWPQSLFRANNMMRKRISGVSVSQPWS